MSAELRYDLPKVKGTPDQAFIINRDSRVLFQITERQPIRRLVLTKDNFGAEIIEYDEYKNGLWVGLMIHPAFPSTDLHDFYLGRLVPGGILHGFHYTKGNFQSEYFTYDSNTGKHSSQPLEEPFLDWTKLSRGKEVDFANSIKQSFSNSNSPRPLFVARLIPVSGGPLAQVSFTDRFSEGSTILVNPSNNINIKVYETILAKANAMLGKEKHKPNEIEDFCETMQIAFCNYFPWDTLEGTDD